MPSVRVRGRAYTNLDDVFSHSDNLQAEVVDNAALSPQETPGIPDLHPRISLPLLRQDAPLSSTLPSARRPRAMTSASRVHAHCTLRNARQSQYQTAAVPSPASPLRNTPIVASPSDAYNNAEGMHTIEGLQTVVRISSHGEPGLVEGSINLSYAGDNGNGDGDPSHHHDDVVEHLDVIDPQVGAFASLTNAANSIIIPPSSWYSRKPVLVLPSGRQRKDGVEDGLQFEDSLDRHVKDVLNSPSKIRRTLMGVWSFLKTPMGIITGIYGFLIVFWGAAIVLFLARIINFHNANTQGFWIEVSSQVETGLFTVTSIGLIPSRVLDTYRIWKIWQYKHRTMKLRKKAGLPQLFDLDDLPDPIYDPNYVHVLTEEEQKDLHRQQRKFQYSQTWYRAHGTDTHRAFPISMALWICFLNDGNSIFQAFLCGTMWGLNRFDRPPWTTGLLIPGSFICGIAAAVLIWRGGERTKRVEEVKERLRAALAEKQLPEDDVLQPALRRNSKTVTDSQAAIIKEASEEQALDSDIAIDEHMTVPASRDLKEKS